MKIAFVTSVYDEAVVGPARFARLLSEHYIVNYDLDFNLIKTGGKKIKDVRVVPIQLGLFASKFDLFFISKKLAKFLQEIQRNENFDRIVFNDVILAYHYLKRNKEQTQTIGFINDEDALIYSKGLTFQAWRKRLYKYMQKKAAQRATKIVFNSNYLQNKVRPHYKIQTQACQILRKGITIEDYPFREKTFSFQGRIKVLFVKNNYKRGGLFDLIRALNKLNHLQFSLIIVGPEKHLEMLFHEKPDGHVKLDYKSYVKKPKLIQLMIESDLFCNPAISEALGVANMEAMAIGVPVVTTSAGGIPEVTNYGENAWIAEANNSQHLAKTIQDCISQEELRQKKVYSARKFIEANFTSGKMIQRFEEIIKE